jgi:hypothetical protein
MSGARCAVYAFPYEWNEEFSITTPDTFSCRGAIMSAGDERHYPGIPRLVSKTHGPRADLLSPSARMPPAFEPWASL